MNHWLFWVQQTSVLRKHSVTHNLCNLCVCMHFSLLRNWICSFSRSHTCSHVFYVTKGHVGKQRKLLTELGRLAKSRHTQQIRSFVEQMEIFYRLPFFYLTVTTNASFPSFTQWNYSDCGYCVVECLHRVSIIMLAGHFDPRAIRNI